MTSRHCPLLLRLALSAVVLLASTELILADEDRPIVIRSVKSGKWSEAATWEKGAVPAANARVQIRPGHSVVYDVKSEAVIRGIHVGGVLSFARDRDTLLNVGLILIQAGETYGENGFDCDAHAMPDNSDGPKPVLEVGTANEPIPAGRTAVIRLHLVPGMDKLSCPASVNSTIKTWPALPPG